MREQSPSCVEGGMRSAQSLPLHVVPRLESNRRLSEAAEDRLASSAQPPGALCGLLPQSSFVSFETRRLVRPTLVWRNRTLRVDADTLFEHAYCMPMPGEDDGLYSMEMRLQYGERYGGEGVGANGGGARCGLLAGLQIKGVGPNPLVGEGTAFWHSHGGASLDEGVRDAIWGEVTQIALPFGGVRVLGIVATGGRIAYEDIEGKTRNAARVLVLRQPCLRPAHYLRSIYFRPTARMNRACSDTARTRSAVREAQFGLRHALGVREPGSGLIALAMRLGAQLAASRAKRVAHNLLSPSNLSLDGRWLDFNRATTLTDHGRLAFGKSLDVWRQHTLLARTLADLRFHLAKYTDADTRRALPTEQTVLDAFERTLTARTQVEFLKLGGVPEARLTAARDADLQRLAACIDEIVRRGNRDPVLVPLLPGTVMPHQTGRVRLSDVMVAAAFSQTRETTARSLFQLLPDASLRERFVQQYWDVRDQCLSRWDNAPRIGPAAWVTLNALRLNATLDGLHLHRLNASIADCNERPEHIERLVDDVLRDAQTTLAEPIDSSINLAGLLCDPRAGADARVDRATTALETVRLVRAIDRRHLPAGGLEVLLEMLRC